MLPPLENYFILSLDAPPLAPEDCGRGLLLLDGTWHYASKMFENIPFVKSMEARSLPSGVRTAYPRRQEDCSDPERGLASVEALYVAYMILGRDVSGLLDNYHWREEFLKGLN